MPSRRDVLRTGAVLPMAIALASPAARAALGASEQSCIGVFDERFAQWADFHEAIRSRLERVHMIRGDVTSLWLNHLSHRAQTRDVTLVGLTIEQSLFCLDLMLRDHGMRVIHREDHAIPNPATAGASVSAHPTAFVYQRSHYTVAARASVMAAARAALQWRPLAPRLGPSLRESSNSELTLVSWVISARPGRSAAGERT